MTISMSFGRCGMRSVLGQSTKSVHAVSRTLLRAVTTALMFTVGCGGTRGQTQAAQIALPGPPGADPLPPPQTSAEKLPGVHTDKLVAREREQWWRLVSQLYAPCSDQAVSIAQCVKESRACGACAQAANFLSERVRSGSTYADAEAAYGRRFGPAKVSIDVGSSPSRGPRDAKVTIIVWSDFECPACGFAMPFIDKVFEKYSPHVRLVHKFYPLTNHHVHAEGAARAAIGALRQGRYWEMERLLFENQSALTEADLMAYASQIKLDLDRLRVDMKSDAATQMIARDKADADRAGLAGTPFILINGREFDLEYFRPETELETWVAMELSLAGLQGLPPKPTVQAPPAAVAGDAPPPP
jgi:protein-disulfide isomerase